MDRFYKSTQGVDQTAYIKALSIAFDEAKKKNVKRITLLVNHEQNKHFFDFLERQQNVSFSDRVDLDEGIFARYETLKTNSSLNCDEVVIACGFASEELYPLDFSQNIKSLISLSWTLDANIEWARTWGAIDIDTNLPASPYQFPSKVVQSFADICVGRNLRQTHQPDDELIKTDLRAIHKYEPQSLDADVFFAYIHRKSTYYYENSKYIRSLIQRLNTGGSFKGGKTTGLKSVYDNLNSL